MYKHILVPTDGSELSRAAIGEAVRLARAVGAKVTGFHVVPEYHPQVFGDFIPHPSIGREAFEAGARATAEKYLSIVKHEAAAAKVRCATDYAASDLVHRAIIKAARSKKCDLIVMASHGRRGLAKLLLGSQATKVLTLSTVPVLVCR
jgi:nucleotide-binding universal stress UspA family protein